MKKSSFFYGLIGSALVLGSASASYASCPPGLTCGNANPYNVTVHQIELCTGTDAAGTGCVGAAIIGQGARTFNIASASVGTAIGSYGTISNLQVGATYTHMRVTIGASFDLAGSVTGVLGVPGNTCTTAGTQTFTIPAPGSLPGVTAAMYAAQGMIHNGATVTAVGQLPAPVTITTKAPSFDVAFDTGAGLGAANNGFGACLFFPAPPSVTFTYN